MSDLFLRPLFTWRSALASELGPQSPVTRHVLLTLALHMNEKGESCFPSIDTLTEETNLARRSVIGHLQEAEREGWIGKRAMRMSNGHGWRRVEYFAVIPPQVEAMFHTEQRSATDAPRQRGAGDAPRSEAGASDDRRGAPDGKNVVQDVHPSTSVNSSKNSSLNPEFEKAWETLPKRAGNNPKAAALKAWTARIKAGVRAEDMQAGAQRYATFMRATGKEKTEYVMMASTFFGRAAPFDQDWEPPAKKERKEVDPWWIDDKGIDRKGRELGMKPIHGEDYPHYKSRIFAEIRKREGATV